MSSSPFEWLCLATYGEHPSSQGLQSFTREAAVNMAQNFHSFLHRTLRGFAGIPIYIGHPDAPLHAGKKGHRDGTVYGRVCKLEARSEGLWMQIKWKPAGIRLIEIGRYHFFSPYWKLVHIGEGCYVPTRLLSVGFTNKPNIPGPCIANQSEASRLTDKPALKTQSDTLHLRFSNSTSTQKPVKTAFLEAVKAGQRSSVEPYVLAWSRAKRSHASAYQSLDA